MSGLDIDRMAERRGDANWLEQTYRDPETQILAMHRGRLLVAGEAAQVVRLDASQLPGKVDYCAFLGRLNNRMLFAASVAEPDVEPLASHSHGQFMAFRQAIPRLPAEDASLAAYARALDLWQRQHRFCGRCGSPAEADPAGFRRICTSGECGKEHFPRLDPAIITVVGHRGRCLLGRQPSWPAGRYSTLAGFVEPGESLEDAVRREVLEESGVRVASATYHSSQPWPFPSSLMVGFFAEAADAGIRRGEELEDVQWFEVDELERAVRARDILLPYRASVSYRLIADWMREQHGVDVAAWREKRS